MPTASANLRCLRALQSSPSLLRFSKLNRGHNTASTHATTVAYLSHRRITDRLPPHHCCSSLTCMQQSTARHCSPTKTETLTLRRRMVPMGSRPSLNCFRLSPFGVSLSPSSRPLSFLHLGTAVPHLHLFGLRASMTVRREGNGLSINAAGNAAQASTGDNVLEWVKKDNRRMLHVVYRVGDLDRTIKFYTECLGMKLLGKRDIPEEKSTNAFLGYGPEDSHFVIELTYNYGVDSYDIGAGFGHFGIAVEDAFSFMRSNGIAPSNLRSWNHLLGHFLSYGMIYQIWLVYSEMLAYGVVPNVFTHNILIRSLCNMGMLDSALHFFRTLGEVDTFTYNTLMWGFCLQLSPEKALACVSQMIKKGYSVNNYSANILIKGYCDVGLIGYAEELLNTLINCKNGDGNFHADIISFNTLIHHYCKAGMIVNALQKLEDMKKSGIYPDIVTYNILVYGFCKIGKFDDAKNMLNKISDLELGESSEECVLSVAKKAGVEVMFPDAITYTTLISAYCKQGAVEEALTLYEEMVSSGIFPDVVTYNSIINGLCKSRSLAEAQTLFKEMKQMEIEPNHVSFTTIIDAFLKDGNVVGAFAFLSQMVVRGFYLNIVLYTCMMDGLFKAGKTKEAEDMFKLLLRHNMTPDQISYSALIDGYCKMGDMKKAETVLQEMEVAGVPPNVITYSSMINGYVKEGKLEEAFGHMRKMIDHNVLPDSITYGTLIAGCVWAGKQEFGLELYKELKLQGLEENNYIVRTIANIYKRSQKMDEAMNLLKDVMSGGMLLDRTNYTNLMDAYFKLGDVSTALNLAQELIQKGLGFDITAFNVLMNGLLKYGRYKPESVYGGLEQLNLAPDAATYNTMIRTYIKDGRVEEALKLWSEMKANEIRPNQITCNILIAGLCELDMLHEAMDLLNQMSVIGFHPTSRLHRVVLTTASKTRSSSLIINLHEQLIALGLEQNGISSNTLINVLCSLGMTKKASTILDKMINLGINPDIVTYNSFIIGYCKSSHVKKAFSIYSQMLSEGISPNIVTFNTLLGGIFSMGLEKEVARLMDEMKVRGLAPDATTYNILVSGYAKMRNMKESIRIYCEMVCKGFIATIDTYNRMIHQFSLMGKMSQARELVNEMQVRGRSPNASTYDILIRGWCNLSSVGELEKKLKRSYRDEALKLLKEMSDKGLVPDKSTVACICGTLARTGKKAAAQRLQELYDRRDQIKNNPSNEGRVKATLKAGPGEIVES